MEQCAVHHPALLRPLLQDGQPSGREYKGRFFQAMRCPHCAYITFPIPPTGLLDEYYANEYPQGSASWYNVESDYSPWKTNSRSERIIEIAKRFGLKPGATLHEFGCAFGGTVHQLNQRGFNTSGTELNAGAVEQGRSKGNDAIFAEDAVAYLTRTGIQPQVIYSWHAIEHFTDPFSFIADIKNLLAPDGILILIAPSSATRFSLVYGHMRYVWFGYPEHLHLFSPGCAPSLADRVGMRLVAVETAEYGIEPQATSAALREECEGAAWLNLADSALLGEELIMVLSNAAAVDPRSADIARRTTLKCETSAIIERQALNASERSTLDPWRVR